MPRGPRLSKEDHARAADGCIDFFGGADRPAVQRRRSLAASQLRASASWGHRREHERADLRSCRHLSEPCLLSACSSHDGDLSSRADGSTEKDERALT